MQGPECAREGTLLVTGSSGCREVVPRSLLCCLELPRRARPQLTGPVPEAVTSPSSFKEPSCGDVFNSKLQKPK